MYSSAVHGQILGWIVALKHFTKHNIHNQYWCIVHDQYIEPDPGADQRKGPATLFTIVVEAGPDGLTLYNFPADWFAPTPI